MRSGVTLVAALGLLACQSGGSAADIRGEAPAPRIILKLIGPEPPSRPEILTRLSEAAGTPLAYVRPVAGGAHVLRLPPGAAPDLARILKNLEALPEVEYATVDAMKRAY